MFVCDPFHRPSLIPSRSALPPDPALHSDPKPAPNDLITLIDSGSGEAYYPAHKSRYHFNDSTANRGCLVLVVE